MKYIFDELGYRRWEWKCNNRNEPSKRAALRFGFTSEGVFRQNMVIKGENRDTPGSRSSTRNGRRSKMPMRGGSIHPTFDRDGNQKRRLEDFRK
jgi:hypothetical protein